MKLLNAFGLQSRPPHQRPTVVAESGDHAGPDGTIREKDFDTLSLFKLAKLCSKL